MPVGLQGQSAEAAKLKAQGTEAFQKKSYDEAIKFYTEAIAISNMDHLLYSNRSAAYAGAKNFVQSLEDGQKCVELKPDFAKGYGRMALAQYHLNRFFSAKKSYEKGLEYDSQSSVLKDGLRDTKKAMRPWIISCLKEAANVQSIVQEKISEASHRMVSDGHKGLSFLEAHEEILKLNLPADVLEKNDIDEEDFQLAIADYDRKADYEVITAAQQLFQPSGKGSPDRASKLDVSALVDANKFMVDQMKSIVGEFNQLPDETKHSIPKKTREHVAELMVAMAVELSLKILSEDLELAVQLNGEQLYASAEYVEVQSQLGEFLKHLIETPYIEKTSKTVVEPSSRTDTSAGKNAENVRAPSVIGEHACTIGIAAAVGIVVLFGLVRWRKNSK